jgi:hypothetical protein
MQIFGGKARRQLWISRHAWDNIIKMDAINVGRV